MTHSYPIIGFDAKRALGNSSGLGTFSRTLLNDLSMLPDKGLTLRLYSPMPSHPALFHQLTKELQDSLAVPPHRCRLYGDYWRSGAMVSDLRQDGVTLYHGLSGELPRGLQANGIKGVVTIHDLIFLIHPEYYSFFDRRTYLRRYRRTLQEANAVVAISECTRRDILRHSHLRPDQVHVVYQGISRHHYHPCTADRLAEVQQRHHLPAQYVLSVGTVEPRKNVLLAVRALATLPQDVHLVVVGHPTAYIRQIQQEAAALGITSRIHLLSQVSNEDLDAIYQLAVVFVYPSIYEGFGIPIVEAIGHGLPVVACTGSCLEEAGGPSNFYVAPQDVTGMSQALASLLASPERRKSVVEAARRHIARFNNETAANNYLSLYHKLCGAAH